MVHPPSDIRGPWTLLREGFEIIRCLLIIPIIKTIYILSDKTKLNLCIMAIKVKANNLWLKLLFRKGK
jgi:hypothetical protein